MLRERAEVGVVAGRDRTVQALRQQVGERDLDPAEVGREPHEAVDGPHRKEKVRAFRTDPEVQQALKDARVDQVAVPTIAAGETLTDLRAEAFDPDEAAKRGMGFEKLDQLALEHLYGVR